MMDATPKDYDGMALNNNDREWIRAELTASATALKAELRPSGARRFFVWLKEWSSMAVIISIPVALIGFCVTFAIATFNRREVEATFRGTTDQHFRSIDDSLREVKGTLNSLKLSSAATGPVTPHNLQQIRAAIQQAKSDGQRLDEPTVVQAASKLLNDSINDRGVWQTAVLLTDYSTNYRTNPWASLPRENAIHPGYHTYYAPPDGVTAMAWFGRTQSPDRAVIRQKNMPDANAGQPFGNVGLLIAGGEFSLDDYVLHHVAISNAVVHYRGGFLEMFDVVFVGCVFVLDPQPQSRALALAVLAQERTVFSSGASHAAVSSTGMM